MIVILQTPAALLRNGKFIASVSLGHSIQSISPISIMLKSKVRRKLDEESSNGSDVARNGV